MKAAKAAHTPRADPANPRARQPDTTERYLGIHQDLTELIFSRSFIIANFFLTSAVATQTLFFWVLILGIIVGLALHLFETPLGRCLTLGLLQALYLLMGAMAGNLSLGLYFLAGMFFCCGLGLRLDVYHAPQP